MQTIAAFDFDGTVTWRDTLLPFLRFTSKPLLFAWKLLLSLPLLLLLPLRQSAKETLLKLFFKNQTLTSVHEQGKAYAQGPLQLQIRPSALQRLRWHQNQGHRCILISASIDAYLKPFGEALGFDEVICSRLAHDDQGCVTGTLIGANCWGPEKVRRLKEVVGPKNYTLFAYGDSRGDKELLALADYPFYRAFR